MARNLSHHPILRVFQQGPVYSHKRGKSRGARLVFKAANLTCYQCDCQRIVFLFDGALKNHNRHIYPIPAKDECSTGDRDVRPELRCLFCGVCSAVRPMKINCQLYLVIPDPCQKPDDICLSHTKTEPFRVQLILQRTDVKSNGFQVTYARC